MDMLAAIKSQQEALAALMKQYEVSEAAKAEAEAAAKAEAEAAAKAAEAAIIRGDAVGPLGDRLLGALAVGQLQDGDPHGSTLRPRSPMARSRAL